MPKMVICLVGPIAAGKGTVDEILQENGFKHYSFSDGIKDEIKKRGIELTRHNLNLVSNEMREKEGADYWARVCGEKIDSENPEKAIVDGARNPHEIEFLKDKYDAEVLGITADQKIRYDRLKARGTAYEDLTFDEFKELDDRENTQSGDKAQNINESLKLADVIIDNDGPLEDLRAEVEKILEVSY